MPSSKSNVEELYTNWNNDLYQRYLKLFPEREHTTIWDGVIDPTLYSSSPLKIMFFNKEGYTEEGNEYDVSEALFSEIKKEQRIFPNQTTLRTHLKQYLLVLQRLEAGLLATTSDENMREIITQNSNDEKWFNSQVAKVAYCNVKKSDGQANSSAKDLHNYAQKGLDILKEQIRFFNPTIILAGNVCEGVLEDLFEWGENLYVAQNHQIAIWQIKIDGKCYPFVDMYHPSYAGLSEYYLDLLHALQAVEEKTPNFWTEKLNQPCFDLNSAIIEEKPQVTTASHNEAEIILAQGQKAAQEQDWETAVRYYQKAAKLNYPGAYYELGEFCEKVFYKQKLYKDEYWDDFNANEYFYYDKALELGDRRTMLRFVEDHINYASDSFMSGMILFMLTNPFTLFKRRRKFKEEARKAIEYMNCLISEKYQPALLLLQELQETANQEEGTRVSPTPKEAREILQKLNY